LFDDEGSDATDIETSGEASPQEAAGIWQTAILFVKRLPWAKRLLLGGAVLVGTSVGALTLAWAMSMTSLPLPARANNLRQALAQAGLGELSVDIRDNGLVVAGHLSTLAQRSKLEQLLAKLEDGKMPRLAVWVDDQVTADVGGVYRLNGIAAEVHSAGPGMVRVHTHEGDAAALEKVKAIALRDVPGLRQLVSVNDPPPIVPPDETAINDPGKRLAAIIPGDPAYVKTADGTLYFEGAMLPNGYRLVTIMPDHIRMERDGVIRNLKF
jgi:type III secretion protein D